MKKILKKLGGRIQTPGDLVCRVLESDSAKNLADIRDRIYDIFEEISEEENAQKREDLRKKMRLLASAVVAAEAFLFEHGVSPKNPPRPNTVSFDELFSPEKMELAELVFGGTFPPFIEKEKKCIPIGEKNLLFGSEDKAKLAFFVLRDGIHGNVPSREVITNAEEFLLAQNRIDSGSSSQPDTISLDSLSDAERIELARLAFEGDAPSEDKRVRALTPGDKRDLAAFILGSALESYRHDLSRRVLLELDPRKRERLAEEINLLRRVAVASQAYILEERLSAPKGAGIKEPTTGHHPQMAVRLDNNH